MTQDPRDHALTRLAAMIAARVDADPATSYTAKLLARGPALAAKKLGEEAVELAIAAAQGDTAAAVLESADLLYHWLVLMASLKIAPETVYAELDRRHGVSGLAEKAARPKD